MIARLPTLSTKPVAITEVGSSTATVNGISVAAKSQWIGDFHALAKFQNIRMVVWFNEDKESDWAVFGGTAGGSTFRFGRANYKVYTAYKDALRDAAFVGSNTADPRLLTDSQFVGQ